MRTPADLPRRVPRTSRRFRLGVLVALVVLIVVLTTVRDLARFYTSYLWFQSVHFTSVFRGVLLTKVALGAVFCLIFFVLMLVSLTVADRRAPLLLPAGGQGGTGDELVDRYREVVRPHGRPVRIVTSVIFALFAGIGTNHEWNNWDLFLYHVNFGIQDPQYHHDIGFYVFQVPFLKFLIGWTFEALIVVLIVTLVAMYLNGGIRFQGQGQRVSAPVKVQVSVTLGLLAIVQGVNYWFDRLLLVLSTNHLVDGATATSVHANAPADYLLVGIAVVAAGLFLYNIRAQGWTLPVVGVAVWLLVWLVVGNIYPALYQALRVSPSELTRETPYLARNIAATRAAYGLDDVRSVTNFDSTQDSVVPTSDIAGDSALAAANRQTLANVPLLDPNQVLNTFEKLQSKKTYYSINGLSVDRYDLPNATGQPTMTETLTGVRELNSAIPSGFTNQHLQYTHGYGSVVAPASQSGVDSNGNPVFSVSDIPPTGDAVVSQSDQGAQNYYGEGSDTGGFVIADSRTPELNYQLPNGNESTTRYEGPGGVPAGSLLRRAAFALSFGSPDILLSGQVTAGSKIIYNRNITARVEKAAPFLNYDSDPYAAILNGQTYWIVDAYTTTANYPYSQDANLSRVPGNSGLSGTFNYVRNSVKVVVNAYTGNMDFFVVDPSDPIIRVYEKAFPDLFKPGSEADKLIPGITSHWRYPEDLFKVQTNMYGRYHLTNVSAFYTQANAWNISEDPGSGRPGTGNQTTTLGANGLLTFTPKKLDPQYEVAHLPGQTQQEFLDVQPFVPFAGGSTSVTQNQNLTAVMFASADPGDYGQLTVYTTPPAQTIDGPQLVQSTIYNNSAISSELTLLNQQGTQVLLGEVVTVPISNTLVFVQPVYVQSSINQVPALKDVIVVYNGTAYHSDNPSLDAALCQIRNPDGSAPFNMYCGTTASQRPTTKVTGKGGSGTGTTTTTTAPSSSSTTTPVTTPAQGASVAQLLTASKAAFAAADAALRAGDLAAYQGDIAQAQSDVARAQAIVSGTTSTTTGSTTTTTTPKTTTTARG